MSDFQQTLTSLSLLHTSLYRMQLFQNAHAVKNVKTDVISIISRLEKAERERDELRAEQAEHDEQIARMESKFSLAKRALDSKTARCEKAEAELRRRDAAAGEPVGLQCMGDSGRWQDCSSREVAESHGFTIFRELYTAAPPAVLPPELSFNEALQLMHEYMLVGDANSFLMGANWMRAQAMALGAQQQNVVELPMPFDVAINLTRTSGDIEYQYHESGENFDRDEIFSVLDAANVKWEVKK